MARDRGSSRRRGGRSGRLYDVGLRQRVRAGLVKGARFDDRANSSPRMTTAPVTPEPTDPAPSVPPPPQKLPRLYPVLLISPPAVFILTLITFYLAVSFQIGRSVTPYFPIIRAIAFQCLPAMLILRHCLRQRVRRANRAGRAFDPTDVATLFRSPPPIIDVEAGPTDAPDGRAVHREFVVVRALVIGVEWLLLHMLILEIEGYRRARLFPDLFPEFLRPSGPDTPGTFYAILATSLAAGIAAVAFHALYVLWRTKLGPDDCPSCGYHAVHSDAIQRCPECGEPLPERA